MIFSTLFRFEYDKKMSELSCADEDHPLKQAESLPLKPDTDAGVEGISYIYFSMLKKLFDKTKVPTNQREICKNHNEFSN